MAFNDTLFQLGMDLTRSSTAQTEDHARAAYNTVVPDQVDPEPVHSVTRAGTAIFIDLLGAKRLDDIRSAERATRRAVESLGLKLKSLHLDRVAGGGVSGVAVLSSGHMSVQACARTRVAALDVRGCAGLAPEAALLAFASAFEAREGVIQKVRKASSVAVPTLTVVPKPARRSVKAKAQAKAA